jgi:hypothetical protein
MELYREFFSIIAALNQRGLDYSVVGGIAMAFHDLPRFTRDIDILARPTDLSAYEDLFSQLGFKKLAQPWTFQNSNLTLHRFGKPSAEDDEDLLVVDLLIGNEPRHEEIIRNSASDESPAGVVRLASREDLIWMKKIRASKQDEADIEKLEEKHDED